MGTINSISIESTRSKSDLCILGAKHGTDKSPYNTTLHRHPYTAVYDLIFSKYRYDNINFAEIGILDNSSMKMWREYFADANLYGFDINQSFIEKARADCLYNTYYGQIDIDNNVSINKSLSYYDVLFDVIIDDSSHFFHHQIAIISQVYRYIRPGGMLIIEDIHRPWGNEQYENAIEPYSRYFSSSSFVEVEHVEKFSEGTEVPWFDNDKLLILHRNRVPAPPLLTE